MSELNPIELTEVRSAGLLNRADRGKNGLVRKYEQAWHRSAAYMFAQGMGAGEVAVACDVTPATITILLNTPWFQTTVTGLMADANKDIFDFLKGAAMQSAVTLVELQTAAKSETVRKAAASEILDRVYGKSIQRIESNTVLTSSDPVAEERRLREENDRLNLSLSGNRAYAEGIRGEEQAL